MTKVKEEEYKDQKVKEEEGKWRINGIRSIITLWDYMCDKLHYPKDRTLITESLLADQMAKDCDKTLKVSVAC